MLSDITGSAKVEKDTHTTSKENKILMSVEQKPVNIEPVVERKSPDLDALITPQEPVQTDITELSGSSLMRALVYKQEGNAHESDSELGNFVLKPAGTMITQGRKKKSPQSTVAPTQMHVSDSEKKSKERVIKSDSDRSNTGKVIHVKNSDKFMTHYNQFVRKRQPSDSGSSDNDIISTLNLKQPAVTHSVSEETNKSLKQTEHTSLYNYIPRGVLSPKEVELCNNRKKSPTSYLTNDAGGNNSACSERSPEKDTQSVIGARNGISLKSLIASQKETSCGTLNGLSDMSSAISVADDMKPVSERMQLLLDAIKKNSL